MGLLNKEGDPAYLHVQIDLQSRFNNSPQILIL